MGTVGGEQPPWSPHTQCQGNPVMSTTGPPGKAPCPGGCSGGRRGGLLEAWWVVGPHPVTPAPAQPHVRGVGALVRVESGEEARELQQHRGAAPIGVRSV